MTNKELQELLAHYPEDMPVAVFCQYECSQHGGEVLEVDRVIEDYLGDINHPSSVACLLLDVY